MSKIQKPPFPHNLKTGSIFNTILRFLIMVYFQYLEFGKNTKVTKIHTKLIQNPI